MNQAAQINQYLAAHHSPLAGMGNAFVRAGSRYGIDPLLLVAITGAESSFGAHLSGSHNPFGWGPGKSFGSFGQAIVTVASGLRTGYLNQGLKTIAQIGGKWAPVGAGNDPSGLNNNWVRNVSGFYGELGGKGVGAAGGSPSPSPGPAPAPEQPVAPDLSGVGFQGLTDIVQHHYSPSRGLQALAGAVASAPQVQPQATKPVTQPTGKSGRVTLAPGADRRGVRTQPIILNFIRLVSGVYGQPLTITTGSQHSEFTVNGNVSDHWVGRGADIPATGDALIALGQSALIAAGMAPAEARKQTGGLYNITYQGHRVQIIFNTHIGGDHTNHLHVGIHP